MSHVQGAISTQPRSTTAAVSEEQAAAPAPLAPSTDHHDIELGHHGPLNDSESDPSLGFAYHHVYPQQSGAGQPQHQQPYYGGSHGSIHGGSPQPPYGGPQPVYSGPQAYGSPQPYGGPPVYGSPQQYGGGPQPYGSTGTQSTVIAMQPMYGAADSVGERRRATRITKRPWDSIDFAATNFSDKEIRRQFIAKVYIILFIQLSTTFAIMSFCIFHEPTRLYIKMNPWLNMLAFAVYFAIYMSLVCFPAVRRNYPANYIALFVFTLALSFLVAVISSRYTVNSVLTSVGVTALVTLSLTIFALQTKVDFTPCAGMLCALAMLVFFVFIASVISTMLWGPSYIWRCVVGGLAAFLFSLFIIHDTQMLMGGREVEISPEEYIFAAIQLYVDIIDLFLIILQCFLGDRE